MYLKGFTNIGDSLVTNHTRENLIQFFDYGLLEKGNFINVNIPTTGVYGGSDHRLRMVRDPRYTTGQVWETVRSNLVWESGFGANVGTDNSRPGISGVYVNGTFYSTATTGTYAHKINHPLGRVIFNSPIPATSVVTCNYSYKYITVCAADGINFFRQIQQNADRSDGSGFITGSGEYARLSPNRLQLPAIGIEIGRSRSMRGFALGGGQICETEVLLHCIAEDIYLRDSLVDIVTNQNQVQLFGFDIDLVASGDSFPLNISGVPVSGAKMYPSLISSFRGNEIRIKDSKFDSIYSLTPNIHVGTVKITTECVLFGV